MSTFKHPFNDSLNQIKERLETIVRYQKIQILNEQKYVLLDNADMQQLFKISQKTVTNWREDGILPFTQIKGKIYYRLSDVKTLIDKNYQIKKKV